MPPKSVFLAFSCMMFFSAAYLSISISAEQFASVVWPILLLYLGFTYLRYSFFFLGIWADIAEKLFSKNSFDAIDPVLSKVSVIVPCFNEEASIAKVIENLCNLDYPNYEVVIIDDGSTDQTYAIAVDAAKQAQKVPITVFTKTNGGKAAALNFGFCHSSGNLILCVDADSRIAPNSLSVGVRHFTNPKVGAVAGFVHIGNIKNILVAFQQLEYMIGLNYLRRAYSFLGIVPIVPGPIGLFRRAAILDAGGFSEDRKIFAEDAELSLRLIAHGWHAKSEAGMVAYTEAPATVDSLLRQRYRWNRGTFQAIYTTFDSLKNSKRTQARFLAWHLLSEIYFIPVINICLLEIFALRLLFHSEGQLFTPWMGSILILEFMVAALVLIQYPRKIFWILVMFISRFTYDIILYMWRFFCLMDEFKEMEMTWDKLDRDGGPLLQEGILK